MSLELAERRSGGVLVRLLWSSEEDAVHVEYYDLRTGEAFRIPVPKREALAAFEHPHAYRRPARRPRRASVQNRLVAASVWDACHEVDPG